jgi:hypothetical protein
MAKRASRVAQGQEVCIESKRELREGSDLERNGLWLIGFGPHQIEHIVKYRHNVFLDQGISMHFEIRNSLERCRDWIWALSYVCCMV